MLKYYWCPLKVFLTCHKIRADTSCEVSALIYGYRRCKYYEKVYGAVIIVLLIYFFLASNRLTTWPYMISAIAETNAIAPK